MSGESSGLDDDDDDAPFWSAPGAVSRETSGGFVAILLPMALDVALDAADKRDRSEAIACTLRGSRPLLPV